MARVHHEHGTWTVPTAGARPSHSARLRAGLHGTTLANGGMTPCAGCARFVAVGDATVHVNGEPVAVSAVQMDRVVNDHPAFIVEDGPVAYHPATVVLVCARCNGTPADRARVLDALEAAALRRLFGYGDGDALV